MITGRVARSEHVIIDPQTDRLEVGTRSVWAGKSDLPADNYRIFFIRSIDRPRTEVLAPTPAPVVVESPGQRHPPPS